MAVLSVLRSIILKDINGIRALQGRHMSGGHGPRTMRITPSKWQWHKFKDMTHFYFMLGAVPLVAITLYANIFIGPAQLTEIPEDYIPKEYEYSKHPITRFLTRLLNVSHQREYEKLLHYIYEEDEKSHMRLIEKKATRLMGELGDSQAYYYQPLFTKYHKVVRDEYRDLEQAYGVNVKD